jgi:lipopolysaccharide/colanic/teichoic acid biosynthesis glycosyltransferase
VTPRPGRGARAVKAALDRVGAAAALAVLAPVLLAVAAGVRLTSPGPVLYRRRVVGRGGAEFDALKFRTMVADADRLLEADPALGARFRARMKLADDPRVTPFGRWLRRTSLDELPQLWNVLRGEMSLVGPRMVTRQELPRFGPDAAARLRVRPGLTGLWQVSGRQDLDPARRAALDREYLERWSLGLDLRILLRTLPAVWRGRGAW